MRYSVVMLPWLAHGHIFPFLELARRLCEQDEHDIEVHICSTPINLLPIRDHVSMNNADDTTRLKLVELHLPPFPGLSPPLHTTKFLPPHLMPSLKHAFDLSQPAFSSLLDTLCPDLVIYDFLMPWAPLAAQSRGIPAFVFMTSSAASTSFFYHYSCIQHDEFPFPAIRLGKGNESRSYANMLDKSANGLSDRDRLLRTFKLSTDFITIKTLESIESKYIKYLSFLTGKVVIPVGPLIPKCSDPCMESEESERVMAWLREKERKSVVFVSFGTEYFMSEEEMEQIAHGLELSRANFLWVVRSSKQEETKGKCAITERIDTERGMVVKEWAPQRSILAHPSVGAFLTHCGWSSVMEGMQCGVPMIALPLHLDQPLNAKLIVELGVAVEIPQDGFPNFKGNFKGKEIAKAITLVLHSEHGQTVRNKAACMAEMMRQSGHHEIQILLQKMVAVCNKEDKCLIAN